MCVCVHLCMYVVYVCIYAAPGICLGDSSDIIHGIYRRVVLMTAFVVYPEAIIRGWLL